MKAASTDFLLICIKLKRVKWIELSKDWLHQHQIWYMASGDEKTNFYYKWARLVKKHGRHRPMYLRNGRGLEIIGRISHTLCPIITKRCWLFHNSTGDLPTKACWAQPIGGAINAISM